MKNTVLKFLTLGAALCGMSAWAVITTQDDFVKAAYKAVSGDTLELGAGEFAIGPVDINGKTLTFKGQGAENTKVYIGKGGYDGNGGHGFSKTANMTFEDLTLDDLKSNEGYLTGFTDAAGLTFRNVTFDVGFSNWGNKGGDVSFYNCTFNQNVSGKYNIQELRSANGTKYLFDGCIFICSAEGRFINAYKQGGQSVKIEITVKNCTFNNTGASSKAVFNLKDESNGCTIDLTFIGTNTANGPFPSSAPSALFQTTSTGWGTVYLKDDDDAEPIKIWANNAKTSAWVDPNGYTPAPSAPEVEIDIPAEVAGDSQAVKDAKGEVAAAASVAVTTDTGVAAVGTTEGLVAALKAQAGDQADAITAESSLEKFISVKLDSVEVGQDSVSLVYDVAPMVKTTVDETAVEAVIPNGQITGAITFRLPLTSAFTKAARVQHEGDPDRYPVIEKVDGKRFVTVTANHFSPFTVTPSDKVKTTLATPNAMAIKRVPGVSDATAGSEVVAAVPWKALDAEADVTIDKLIATGVAVNDEIAAWDSTAKKYYIWKYTSSGWVASTDAKTNVPTPDAAFYKPQRGQAVWYKRQTPGVAYSQIGGYVSGNVVTETVEGGTASAVIDNLLINPYFEAVELTKLTGCAAGDVIQVFDTGKVYTYKSLGDALKWTIHTRTAVNSPFGVVYQVGDKAVESIPLPAGVGFWYVSKGGTPTIDWKALKPTTTP